jgi:phosphatidylserine decarboxylase
MEIKMKDRTGNLISVEEDKFTLFLYKNYFGRLLLKVMYKSWFSKLVGKFMDSPLSKYKINKFIKNNHIDMSSYSKVDYQSFNDFFTRQKANLIIDNNKNSLISPCDAKLTVYEIKANTLFKIKNSLYLVKDLINNEVVAKEYLKGYALVFRLCVDDYHRYIYIDDGYQKNYHHIDGVLHTVRPIAQLKERVFAQNEREWCVLHNKNIGNIVEVDIGALCVGKIVNLHSNHQYKRGEEKGYFKFGASTIVLFIHDDIKIDPDIIKNSNEGIETIVKVGEKIGQKK